uniref:Serine/threonine-protein kinase RIO1 n=1 Tax=Paramoeba aestuarina TaxID=180227 RepID=A0A7S4UZM8_9EUKA|mmetsp:Transcript_8449/g.12770  ORF Transcript_8449/g.12770 Transcript_8449/m.12770 type:complete len:395 (+) Transcript_8449:34-1218(+)
MAEADDLFDFDRRRLKKSHQRDKSDRATVENVMDPRTRLLIYTLVRNGFLQSVHGCVSTGKEANVYHAIRPLEDGDVESVAIKVYRTSVLVFKDRERYVKGDFRFQRYCKSNPRKMVQKWAEKEARNLRRLESAGIPAPRVLYLKNNVLIMSFLGDNGWPYPRLSDSADLKHRYGEALYHEVILLLKRLYAECNLVHGDLSEYNMLVHQLSEEDPVELFVIDVSQSVEPDHPNAMEFLRRDIVNVDRYFSEVVPPEKRHSVEHIFQYILGRSTLGEAPDESGPSIPDDVFCQIPIPQSLGLYSGSHLSADVEKQFNFLKAEESPSEISVSALGDALDTISDSVKAPPKDNFSLSTASKTERREHRKQVKQENRERRKKKSDEKRRAKGKPVETV